MDNKLRYLRQMILNHHVSVPELLWWFRIFCKISIRCIFIRCQISEVSNVFVKLNVHKFDTLHSIFIHTYLISLIYEQNYFDYIHFIYEYLIAIVFLFVWNWRFISDLRHGHTGSKEVWPRFCFLVVESTSFDIFFKLPNTSWPHKKRFAAIHHKHYWWVSDHGFSYKRRLSVAQASIWVADHLLD